jgi:hypothetical protein
VLTHFADPDHNRSTTERSIAIMADQIVTQAHPERDLERTADAHIALSEIVAIGELLFASGTSDHELSRDACSPPVP